MCTEWLNRIWDNFIQDDLPFFHDEKVGSYHWGLVAGKSQFYLPWDNIRSNKDLDFRRWQHDLVDVFGTPYDPKELELFRELSPRTDANKGSSRC